MQIGEQIRVLRKRMRLSQAEFAEKLGISQSYLSLIENGKKTAKAEGVLDFFIENLDGRPPHPFTGDVFMRKTENPFIDAFPLIQTGDLGFFKVDNSGLHPIFENGDILLIDRNYKEIRSGQIYLFEIEGKQEIRQAFQLNGGYFKLTSLCPQKKNNDIFLESSMKCIGRVAWTIRKV